ncbi:mucoidy inhibitor MuiA family protein [Pseudooceanicola sp. C21-150M6]|uniref:DUF4139 domain-containing protein n=1 Tax=Pseudooceanicola sp. C21-150M6 TaxID=3434355 RepID=UPI003D7F3412
MRFSIFSLTLLAVPSALWADDIAVKSQVTAATVFPDGATLTRMADVSVPAGTHQIVLTDMPVIDPASLRLSLPGVTMGAIRYRRDFVPPRTADQTAAVEAAEDIVEARERDLEAAQDAVAGIRIEAEAAKARIAFLEGLGSSEGIAAAGLDTIRDLARLISDEGLEARRAVLAAEARARDAQRDVTEAQTALSDAKQALKALDTEDEARAYLTVDVQTDAPVEGEMSLTYAVGAAGWAPTYDLYLTTGDAASLTMDRGAYVYQQTGENWSDIALTLSTVRPAAGGVPGEVWPWLRRIYDKVPQPIPMARGTAKLALDSMVEAAPAPVVAEEVAASALTNGISMTYSYPDKVSIANGADEVRIALGSLEFSPEIYARAVPLSDSTAFLTAAITNETGEIILPAETAQFYLDGTYVGQRWMDILPDGEEAELSFGAIDGLRLERVVKDRQEGDRGVITKSNEETEEVAITLRNLTPRDWEVRLLDRVPVSEQEDLKIAWEASPMPEAQDVDDKRGVLEWRFDMAPGAEQEVALSHRITWPTDKVLR